MNTVFPAIRNWQLSPPAGGWNVTIEINGFERFLQGRDPFEILTQAQTLAHQVQYVPEPNELEDALNAVWIERDPSRALPTATPTPPRANQSRKTPKRITYFGPKDYGPRVWGWLATFGMPGAFAANEWAQAIARVTVLLNPTHSPGTGCAECFNKWLEITTANPPRNIKGEVEAAKWVFEAHNQVNAKLGKPQMKWEDAVATNGWSA